MKRYERKGEFGQRLRAVLVERGLSARRFSELSGVDRALIADYVVGKNAPNVINLRAILNALPDVDARHLICGRGE